jgi:putative FmdB family regulatory protein
MPLYEYECDACGRRFERIQKFSDPPETVCPTCGGTVRKLLSSPAIQFKGSGFYITDYVKSGSGSDGAKKPAEAASGSTEGSDAKSTSAATTEGKSETAKSEAAKAPPPSTTPSKS